MGAHLGESGGYAFTEQADRELVCLFAKASAYTDRSLCTSPRSLGAGSAPLPLSLTAEEHVREHESSVAFCCSEAKHKLFGTMHTKRAQSHWTDCVVLRRRRSRLSGEVCFISFPIVFSRFFFSLVFRVCV